MYFHFSKTKILVTVFSTFALVSHAEQVERLQVTGSHIQRIDVEGPSPIQVVDREMLDNSGYNSVSDVLRDMTASSFGGTRERSGTSSAGTASVSLRGLGADRTLVLLNGKRLPADPITGGVDLNLIPMAAVDRIEILKDGASATYGSDALAGVVNIMTRDDFVGTEITMRTSANKFKGGERTDVSLVNSTVGARGQAITVFNYRNNNKIRSKDRKWSDSGFSTYSEDANAIPVRGTSFGSEEASQNCPSSSLDSEGLCEYKFSDFMDEVPAIEQMSFLTQFNYEITPDITAYARLMANRNEVEWQFAPAAALYEIFRESNSTSRSGIILDAATFDALAASGDFSDPGGGWQNGDSLFVKDRLSPLGPRTQESTTNSMGIQAGLKGYLFDTWNWDVSYDYNKLRRVNMHKNGYALMGRLGDVLGTGVDEYDPFNSRSSDADVLSQGGVLYQPWNESQSINQYSEAMISGEIGSIASRPLYAAFGTSLLNEKYYNQNDVFSENGEVLGSAGSSGAGSRTVYSLYSELSYNPLDSLELQLAGRMDRYNDFGSTVNPKVGFRYQANSKLMFRGSAGTGFKAPTLVELYLAQASGAVAFKDEVGCKEVGGVYCNVRQYQVTQGGNPDLQEERSVSYNLGALYQFSRFTSLGVDFWGIRLKDAVGIDLNKVTLAEKRGIDVEAYGIEVQRGGSGELISMTALNQNLASRNLMGLDLTFRHMQHTFLGGFSLTVEHAQMFQYKMESFPGLGEENLLGQSGLPKWRNNISLGFMPEILPRSSFYLVAKTIGEHEKMNPEEGKLKRYTEFDFQMNYQTAWNGTLTLGILNLFGSTPPLDEQSSRPLNTALYNPFGQSAYLQYSQSF